MPGSTECQPGPVGAGGTSWRPWTMDAVYLQAYASRKHNLGSETAVRSKRN